MIRSLTWSGASCAAAAGASPWSRRYSTCWSIWRNRDRVLSKDDLIEATWKGRVVSGSTLTSRINAVRKAVGDSGKVHGLARRGHRGGIGFIGEGQRSAIAA